MVRMVFGLKRAYQRSLRFVRETLKDRGITPARFDMLMAVWPRGGVWQSQVRKMLGVTRATASEMMIALEKLGFVKRVRDPDDKRQLRVVITKEREIDMHEFVDAAYESGAAEELVGTALFHGCHSAEDLPTLSRSCACFGAESWLDAFLRRVRDNLGDAASLAYALPADPEPILLAL